MTNKLGKEKIAILLAVYNGEDYLKKQIDSILSQSFSDFKIYIHDDGSSDNTSELIDQLIDKNPEAICKVDGPSTGGAKNNFFYLMEQVEADYYMCCDQDDIWLPNKIELSINRAHEIEELHENNKDLPILVFSDLEVVDEELNTIAPSMAAYQNLDGTRTAINRLIVQSQVTGCTMLFNRRLRDMMLIPADRNNIIMHDWWASLIASEFGAISYIDCPTIKYRQHGDNSVGAKPIASGSYQVKRVKQSSQMKESLHLTRMQSAEFARAFGLSRDHVAYQYGELMNKSKLGRWFFYFSKGVLKKGLGRVAGQLVLG